MRELCLALDNFDNPYDLEKIVFEVKDYVKLYKIGLQSFCAFGKEAIHAVNDNGGEILLDLKLHDIPITVEKTVKTLLSKYKLSRVYPFCVEK